MERFGVLIAPDAVIRGGAEQRCSTLLILFLDYVTNGQLLTHHRKSGPREIHICSCSAAAFSLQLPSLK